MDSEGEGFHSRSGTHTVLAIEGWECVVEQGRVHVWQGLQGHHPPRSSRQSSSQQSTSNNNATEAKGSLPAIQASKPRKKEGR